MSVVSRAGRNRLWIACLCLMGALQVGYAQKTPAVATPDATRRVLVEKARALESRGRPDMAIQLWQQILLSDPKNTDALAGIARDYKMIGSTDKAAEALDKLRRANPNDPNIAKIAQMSSTRAESDRLRQAGELARQGKLEDSMRIYRSLYGDRPPDGDIALAYFETLYGTSSGKEQAIQAMRALALRNPGDTRFVIELGIMLTFEARTRAEGIRLLREHPQDANAQAGLRQALLWDAANPTSAGALRQYLKDHPQDQEIAQRLKEDESKLAQMNSGIARTPEERAAFAALNGKRLEEAQRRFLAILELEPNNGRAKAGMGFLRMQENNFGGAISYLTEAEENGFKDRTVETALVTSRFWFTMNEATQAFDDNQLDVAMEKYKAALEMHPHSPEALNGMAGLLIKEQQYPGAAEIYEELVKLQPASADAWRGLFLAYARDNQGQKALAIAGRIPAATRTALSQDPEYLRTLAAIYQALNRNEDARRTLVLALSLPFPDNGSTLRTDTRLQYAGILMEANRFDQGAEIYIQILNEDMGNLAAWQGLIAAHHQMGQDGEAVHDVERMPPATYELAIGDPAFLGVLGGIYQQANQLEVAQGMLEHSAKIQIEAGGQPSPALQSQLAAIYLARNDSAKAYSLYRQILSVQPDSVDAWKGLIASMLNTHHEAEALQEIAQIPASVRKQLEGDIDFVQGEASAYAATGETQRAIETMNRVMAHYTATRTAIPIDVEIQNAWLLYNTKNDHGLYPALMKLGARKELTVKQREIIQTIWASWAVRRAGVAIENNNPQRAVDILEAAEAAFPDNAAVRKTVAGGYVKAGRAKDALNLFKTVPMQDSSAGDFQGAVGAAMAAGDRTLAEQWLRQALDRYPRDAAILQLAAHYEQARGDSQRASDYYRASLAVMPKTSAANRLAHELVYPEQDDRVKKANTPADLQRILDPNYEPFQRVAKLPPLPAYGADPMNSAPVVLGETPARSNANQSDWANAPALPPPPAETASAPARQQTENYLPPELQNTAPAAPSNPSKRSSKTLTGQMHVPAADRKIASPTIPQPAQQAGTLDAQQTRERNSYQQLPAQVSAQPEHSLAGDAWKGLISSLVAEKKAAEAEQQLSQIPPEVRRQLDVDVEFQLALANLYDQLGDMNRADESMSRVQSFYALHHAPLPAAAAVQNALLLFHGNNDSSLYSVLDQLDVRRDLSPAQRQQVESLWATWSVRRAQAEMEKGNSQRGLTILDAAMAQYPGNPSVRMAVAGGYARLGRAGEAMAIYKTAPLEQATADEMQGAVAAAIAVNEMMQAEAWLRRALGRYPSDPGVLAVAARYEQVRGNSQRASDYWRAALAAMPPGQSISKYDSLPVDMGLNGSRPSARPGELKQLLAPEKRYLVAPLPTQEATGPSAYNRPQPSPASQPKTPAQNQPSYIPQPSQQRNSAPSQPVFVEQSSTGSATFRPIANGQQSDNGSPVPLRISSQPMDPIAARTQALFADQIDGQVTRGSAASIDALPPPQVRTKTVTLPAIDGSNVQYTEAQYTPSAQEAATGAYSTPQQTTQPQTTPVPQPAPQPVKKSKPSAIQPTQPPAETAPPVKRSKKKTAQTTPRTQTAGEIPTLENAPVTPPPNQIQVTDLPGAPAPTTTQGLTDEELQQRDLPPLRGPWVRVQRQNRDLSPRDEAEMQLRTIESSYSGWLGGSGIINFRSGTLGYDQLAAAEAPFEVSMPIGYTGRLTIVAKPVFLDSGQADGNAVITVQEQTTSGTSLLQIAEPIGTLVPSLTGTINPPAQQNASGLGGEVQLAWKNFAIAGGYTPYGFLVSTETARLMWKPGNGPFTFNFSRDSVKDTQLSYAGLRDPSGNTLGNEGQIWGAVMANVGNVQYAHGDAQSGFYVAGGGQYLAGYQVQANQRIEGSGGAYWRVLALPEYGNLNIGANFFGMHYSHNENAFTHGMGGYFSPQAYFLGNVPFTWTAHYGTKWHYDILGSMGVQAFQEAKTPLWPLAVDNALEINTSNAALPARTSVGPNYDLRSHMAYQIGPHWFVGGFLSANNSRNYSSASAGFTIRYLFRSQPSTVAGPTGLFPADGIRPFTVP